MTHYLILLQFQAYGHNKVNHRYYRDSNSNSNSNNISILNKINNKFTYIKIYQAIEIPNGINTDLTKRINNHIKSFFLSHGKKLLWPTTYKIISLSFHDITNSSYKTGHNKLGLCLVLIPSLFSLYINYTSKYEKIINLWRRRKHYFLTLEDIYLHRYKGYRMIQDFDIPFLELSKKVINPEYINIPINKDDKINLNGYYIYDRMSIPKRAQISFNIYKNHFTDNCNSTLLYNNREGFKALMKSYRSNPCPIYIRDITRISRDISPITLFISEYKCHNDIFINGISVYDIYISKYYNPKLISAICKTLNLILTMKFKPSYNPELDKIF